jgi:hypothetical protein
MSASYRDDRDAAFARLDALQRENERLRGENRWLYDQLDPDELRPALARAHRRGAAVGAAMLLGALSCVALIARDAASNVARADADLSANLDLRAWDPPGGTAARRPHANQSPACAPSAPATPQAPAPDAVALALAPVLRGCLSETRGRVDVVAAVDARGRSHQVHVLRVGRLSAPRAERRCVRHALASITLPTTRAVYTVAESSTELRLAVIPAATRHGRRAR